MLANLLPQGTRTAELYSAIGLLLVAILLYVTPEVTYLSRFDNRQTWAIVIPIFGMLQLYSIYNYPNIEITRTIMAWIAGGFWLWCGISSLTISPSPEGIASLVLGLSNLYGFVLNLNLITSIWTDSNSY